MIAGIASSTPISVNSNFQNIGGDGYINPFWCTTLFPAEADTYIGATFKLGTNFHYGWIRVNWNGSGTLVVKDFASENTPNAPIKAGDMGTTTGTSELTDKVILIFPNPSSDYINIKS